MNTSQRKNEGGKKKRLRVFTEVLTWRSSDLRLRALMHNDGRLHSAPASVRTISQTAAVLSQLPHSRRSRSPFFCVIYGASVLQSLRYIYWGGRGGKQNSSLLHVRLSRDEPPWKWQLRGSMSVPHEPCWRDWLQELRRLFPASPLPRLLSILFLF